jgi:serine/threonine protein kinase
MRFEYGQLVGNYRLIAELGRGVTSTVYLGVHAFLLQREVAVKLLHRVYLSSQVERDCLLEEAYMLDMLRHPHILPLLDAGSWDGFPYLVMEHASQGTLKHRLDRHPGQPLTTEEALSILAQIGDALQYAHQQRVIHRDLKPSNILFNARGEALIADFSIAIILSTVDTTQRGIAGTPAYMAPEQFQGYASPRSDQYALGCLAYELLTGRGPFTAPDPIAMAFKHAMEWPVPPSRYNPNIPRHIELAVLQAMAKQRKERHADVATFIAALLDR